MSSERERIELLRAALGGAAPGLLLGIGDDAAVLAAGTEPLVWTVDAQVEGVHFRRELLSFADLGYRATMAAASDLAAMGATPRGALASLVLPADVGDDALAALAVGQRQAAEALGTAIAGGNLARGGELSITTTFLGEATEPLRRDGARPGPAICSAGPGGRAGAGLAARARARGGGAAPATAADAALAPAIAAWRRPTARIAAGVAARAAARAAIDVSDGLARDLGHVAGASGVRAVVDPTAVVSGELRAAAAALGVDALDLALHGGEDYALVVVAPPRAILPGFTRIGGCEPMTGARGDVALVAPDGSLTVVAERGFDHFA